MYIEFRLPTGAGGMAAGHALALIKKDIEAWAQKYNIKYKTKLHKYTYRLSLSNDKEYTQFAVTWEPHSHASRNFEFRYPK